MADRAWSPGVRPALRRDNHWHHPGAAVAERSVLPRGIGQGLPHGQGVDAAPVSYTHLDVYKRQVVAPATGRGLRVELLS